MSGSKGLQDYKSVPVVLGLWARGVVTSDLYINVLFDNAFLRVDV